MFGRTYKQPTSAFFCDESCAREFDTNSGPGSAYGQKTTNNKKLKEMKKS